MAQDVVVGATGIVPFSKKNEGTVDTIAASAILDLLRSDDIDPSVIGETYVGTAKGGSLTGQRSL